MKRYLSNSLRGSLIERKWLHSVAERYLRFHWRPKDDDSRKATVRIPLEAELGPIDRAELFLADRGRRARDEILRSVHQFLEERPEERSATEWIAVIALSAIGLGGCLQPKGLDGIAKACASGIRHQQGALLLDWTTDRGDFRFIPDAVTACILAQWLRHCDGVQVELDLPAVRAKFRALLSRLSALDDASYGWPKSKVRETRIRLAVGALLRQTVPGVLMAHILGTRRSTPVPITCLQRALGFRLSLPASPETLHGARREQTTYTPKDDAIDTVKRLRKRIGKIRSSSRTGGASKGTRGARLASLEQDVDTIEKSLLAIAGNRQSSAVCHIVIARLRHLVKKGGRLKRILATSTIAEYMSPVLKFADSESGRSVLSADPSDVAIEYRRIIVSGAESTANVRYRSLEDFHCLAVDQFGVEDVDWADIAEDIPGVVVRVDANLIHPHELEIAIALLDDCTDIPADLCLRAKLAIALMADLGLRFGEVFRLRHMDISPGRRFAFVRNTQDGEVKTINGVRTLPIDALCKPRTKEFLVDAIALTDPLGKLGGAAALFGTMSNPKDLIPRWVVARLANQAIRAATGDPATRLHHLRHTAATNLLDIVVLPTDRERHSHVLNSIVGTTSPTNRALWSLAMLMGHGSGRTTVVSYVHRQEHRIANFMNRELPRLGDALVGILINQGASAVRSYRSRGKNDVSMLSTHAHKVLATLPELAATSGMAISTAPPYLDSAWVPAALTGTLPQIDQLLRLHFCGNLDPATAAKAMGMTPSVAVNLATAAAKLARELRLPLDDEGNPANLVSKRSRLGKNSTIWQPVAAIVKSHETVNLAATAIRTYDHGRYAWCCRGGYTLRNILAWLRLAGVPNRGILVRVPESRWQEAHALLDASSKETPKLRPIDGRVERRRGSDWFVVSLVSTRGTALNHASFLQLVRWSTVQSEATP